MLKRIIIFYGIGSQHFIDNMPIRIRVIINIRKETIHL